MTKFGFLGPRQSFINRPPDRTRLTCEDSGEIRIAPHQEHPTHIRMVEFGCSRVPSAAGTDGEKSFQSVPVFASRLPKYTLIIRITGRGHLLWLGRKVGI